MSSQLTVNNGNQFASVAEPTVSERDMFNFKVYKVQITEAYRRNYHAGRIVKSQQIGDLQQKPSMQSMILKKKSLTKYEQKRQQPRLNITA
jgi:hypothetical protein